MILKVINKIKQWLHTKRCLNNDVIARDITKTASVDTQESRVYRSLLAQKKQMSARAMKAHDASCKDMFNCSKDVCFIPESDTLAKKEKKMDYVCRYEGVHNGTLIYEPHMFCKCSDGNIYKVGMVQRTKKGEVKIVSPSPEKKIKAKLFKKLFKEKKNI